MSETNALKTFMTDVANAIRSKTGKTDKLVPINFPNEILSIETSSGSDEDVELIEKDINFYDYDGTLLHSYTLEELNALTSLPPLPSHEGLTCQEWNWTLSDLKALNRKMDVGATYITDDGATRIHIKLVGKRWNTIPLHFAQTVSNGVQVNWGDGSSVETVSGTGQVNPTHSYASEGEYVISLKVLDGTLTFGDVTVSPYSCLIASGIVANRGYVNSVIEINIGSGVESLGTSCFNQFQSMLKVSIPNTVTLLNDSPFNYNTKLMACIIPKSITALAKNSFYYCQNLRIVSFPCELTYIGGQSFMYNNSLKKAIFPPQLSWDTTNGACFSMCPQIEEIYLPETMITNLPKNCFANCNSLKKVELHGDTEYKLLANAFVSCQGIEKIVVKGAKKTFYTSCFGNCYSISVLDFTECDSVVSSDTGTLYGTGFEIRVPLALVDSYKSATEWKNYKDYIVGV